MYCLGCEARGGGRGASLIVLYHPPLTTVTTTEPFPQQKQQVQADPERLLAAVETLTTRMGQIQELQARLFPRS